MLILTAMAGLLARLMSCLPVSLYIAAWFTGREGLFAACEQVAAYVQEMDCVYFVNWDAWLPRIRGYFPVGVQKPGDDDGEMDKPKSHSDDEVERVKGGLADTLKLTPLKERQASQDDGDSDEETRPKKSTTKAKDSAPLNTFHTKRGRPRARTKPPRRSSVLSAMITTSVSVNVLCWVHGSLCDGQASNSCHFSCLEIFGSCSAQTRRVAIFCALQGHLLYVQVANHVHLNCSHEHEMQGRGSLRVLLDVAKAFSSTIHEVIFSILNHGDFLPNYVAAFRKVYAHADTNSLIQWEPIYFKPPAVSKKDAPAFHFCLLL